MYRSQSQTGSIKWRFKVGPVITVNEMKNVLCFLLHRTAERIYLEQGDIEAALQMYTNLRRWDDAIKLAERRGYHRLTGLREEQMSYLLSTGQEEYAGHVFEERGETDQAMTLYMKSKKTSKAARLDLKTPHLLQDEELMNRIAQALVKSGIEYIFIHYLSNRIYIHK